MASAQVIVPTALHMDSSLNRNGKLPSEVDKSSMSTAKNYQSSQNISQINMSYLNAIQAVVFFGYPEELVRKYALNMVRSGKEVTSKTLLIECELQSQSKSSCTTNNSDSSESIIESVEIPVVQADCRSTSSSLSDQQLVPSQIPSLPYDDSDRHTSAQPALSNNSITTTASSLPSSHSNCVSQNCQSSAMLDTKDDVDGCHSSSVSSISHDRFPGWSTNNLLNNDPAIQSDSFTELKGVSSLSQQLYSVSQGCNQSYGVFNTDMPSVASLTTSQIKNNLQDIPSHGLTSPFSRSQATGYQNRKSLPLNVPLPSIDLPDIVIDGVDITNLHEIDKDSIPQPDNITKQAPLGAENSSKAKPSAVENKAMLGIYLDLVEKEHAMLKKSRLCSSCSTKPRDITFLPCGHFTTCRSCAEPIFVCPVCSSAILATIDTFLS